MRSPSPTSQEDIAANVGVTSFLKPVLVIFANVAVITALLVYFGWVRTIALAREIGINETVYLFSTQDYVQRSVGSVFDLLILVAVVGVLLLAVDRLTSYSYSTDGRNRTLWIVVVLLVIATALVLIWLVRVLEVPVSDMILPVLLATGIASVTYSVHLAARRRDGNQPPSRLGTLDAFSAIALVACLFWATSLLANSEGTMLGQRLNTQPSAQLPRIELTSDDPLYLSAEEVTTSELIDNEGRTTYRYRGLLLLGNTKRQLLVVPDRAPISEGPVFVLTDDESLRFDFVP